MSDNVYNSKLYSPRLSGLLKLVREGSFLADIGADHAYVAIEAVKSGLCRGALATDLRDGPIQRAAANVTSAGLDKKVFLMKTDGMTGIEKYEPTDIIIAGMGGELIADIIASSAYAKKPGINLVLQPMTSAYELRKYLYGEGFDIKKEMLVREDNRFYQLMSVEYSGKAYVPTEAELHLGAYNISNNGDRELFYAFVNKETVKHRQIYSGRLKAGLDTSYEKSLLNDLEKLLNNK